MLAATATAALRRFGRGVGVGSSALMGYNNNAAAALAVPPCLTVPTSSSRRALTTSDDGDGSGADAAASTSSSSSSANVSASSMIDQACMSPLTGGGDKLKNNNIGSLPPGLRPIYLDYQATSPLDPRVLDQMMPFFSERYGNAHSRTHAYGWNTEEAVEVARARVADMIGATAKEIFFTSGATESNNIAIKGVADFNKSRGKKHIITLQTEHKCVLDSCRYLEMNGYEVSYLPVEKNGLVNLDTLAKTIRPDTSLVSIMMVHNEIGVIQPINEIGKLCRSRKVLFHSDAAQAFGKIPIAVDTSLIDLLSISGHKIYGPKGVGALYLRRRPRVRVRSPVSGGGQERGVRSGTLAVAQCVGLGAAAALAKQEMARDHARITTLHKRLLDGLTSQLSHLVVNGDLTQRYPGNLNISFSCVEGESLLMGIHDVAVSSGSACTSASLEPSYVLRALGIDAENAHTSIRFGIGRFTTEAEVDYTVSHIVKEVARLRDLSPLWDLIQDGKGASDIEWRT